MFPCSPSCHIPMHKGTPTEGVKLSCRSFQISTQHSTHCQFVPLKRSRQGTEIQKCAHNGMEATQEGRMRCEQNPRWSVLKAKPVNSVSDLAPCCRISSHTSAHYQLCLSGQMTRFFKLQTAGGGGGGARLISNQLMFLINQALI